MHKREHLFERIIVWCRQCQLRIYTIYLCFPTTENFISLFYSFSKIPFFKTARLIIRPPPPFFLNFQFKKKGGGGRVNNFCKNWCIVKAIRTSIIVYLRYKREKIAFHPNLIFTMRRWPNCTAAICLFVCLHTFGKINFFPLQKFPQIYIFLLLENMIPYWKFYSQSIFSLLFYQKIRSTGKLES